MERLPNTYATILTALVELYNALRRPIKSREIAEKLNVNEGTIRNIMIALKIMGFIDSKTGPYGGYIPTQKAFEYIKSPNVSPIAHEIVPIHIGSMPVNVYAVGIEILDLLNPFGNKAIVRTIGDIRSVRIGEKVRIGPSLNTRIVIEGTVVDKSVTSNEIVVQIDRIMIIPRVKISDVMTRNLITIHKDTTLRQAAEIFAEHRIRALPVIDDDGRIIGLITTSDLAAAVAKGDLNSKVSNYMRKEVPVIHIDSDIYDAVKLMLKHRIGRLIVIDSAGKPVGIVTRTDVLKYIALLE
ncbi:MAG: CBS domain-containing protein [Crenarchaeota archaeon]|nr:CBS domain-containing protein [Thermoproteota archaeon]